MIRFCISVFIVTWPKFVTPGRTDATYYLSPSSSAMCCRLHLPPAVGYLKPAVHISFSRSVFHVFFGCPPFLWPCCVHCTACLTTLSSSFLSVCPSQFHCLLHSWVRWRSTLCQLICETPLSAQQPSDNCWKHTFSLPISTFNALEVSHVMRYINLRYLLTYLLIYLLT